MGYCFLPLLLLTIVLHFTFVSNSSLQIGYLEYVILSDFISHMTLFICYVQKECFSLFIFPFSPVNTPLQQGIFYRLEILVKFKNKQQPLCLLALYTLL